MDKSGDAFRTISEAAEELNVPQHVLRFWETRFSQIKPLKRGGGRRYYRRDDVNLLRGIRYLLYAQGYTIKGVQRILKEGGLAFVQNVWRNPEEPIPASMAMRDGDELAGAEATDGAAPSVILAKPPGANPQGTVLIRRTDAVVLSAQDRKALQLAVNELTEARRLLDLAGRI
jgi:DNA-binding transcriptional MerR regulator